MGWTRAEAVDFLLESTALTRSNAEQEVDRYIADPGQATSYMIGRLEIDRLRTTAEHRLLGDQLDVAAFHDVVLGSATTPLTALDQTVSNWLDTSPRAEPEHAQT